MNNQVDDLQKAMADLVSQQTDSGSVVPKNRVVTEEPAPKPATPATTPPKSTETSERVEVETAPPTATAPASKEDTIEVPTPTASSSDMSSAKQEAVMLLRPLIDKIDITPEEKFDALIEIIRASDDEAMIPKALEAAKGIEDQERRAQALIDVINEINYINKTKV